MGIFNSKWSERKQVEEALHSIFHKTSFRQGQEEIIRDITSGHDTLAVLPTGGGKSLCYQLPAVVMPGLTLVISPLIALMKDQVDALKRLGIRAEALNSQYSPAEKRAILDDVRTQNVKLLFVAPERLALDSFSSLLSEIHVGMIAVDEAHCISQWGHDFRPAYRQIGELRTALGDPPTIALTATASPEVQQDIVTQLHLNNPKTHILGFDRKNLLYSARIFHSERQKLDFVIDFVRSNIQQQCFSQPAYEGCGIVYASTIRQAQMLFEALNACGIRTGLYYAGMPDKDRIQDAFMEDAYHCLVATNAFGMGVDKPNIRFVIHMSLSSSVEAYTQEAGRAGRDTRPAQCILLYTRKDVKIQESFINNGAPDEPVYKAILDTVAPRLRPRAAAEGKAFQTDTFRENYKKKTGHILCEPQLDTALRKLRSLGYLDIDADGTVRITDKKITASLAGKLAKESAEQAKKARQRLESLIEYVYEENCRTRFILKYFGSKDHRHIRNCQHCDLCHNIPPAGDPGIPGPFPPEPTSTVILKIVSTIARFNKHDVPVTHDKVAAILHGSCDACEPFVTTSGALAYMNEIEIRILLAQGEEYGLTIRRAGEALITDAGARFMCDREHRLEAVAPAFAEYLSVRFPEAARCAGPWHPEP